MATVKIKLRQKPISGKRASLYLDFYPAIISPETGKITRREFLGLYITPKTKDPLEKHYNSEQLKLAEEIRRQRENTLNKPEIYSEMEREKLNLKVQGERDFVSYFNNLANKRNTSNQQNWVSTYKYLNTFSKGSWKFSEITIEKCHEFRDFLLTTKASNRLNARLSRNSAASYFNKFKAALKQAFKDGIIEQDINSRIEPIKPEETHRNYLSLDELNKLVKTACVNPLLKNAALFSALTGMRFSDIVNLTWNQIRKNDNGEYSITFKQQKTQGAEVLPISTQAISLIGKPGKGKEKVFEGLTYSAYQNKHLSQWIGAAGIERNMTFHSFRHTYATLQLSNGTDIYTVSKLLGHRDLKTTQIYAKVIDQKKREAIERIKIDL